MIKRTIPLILAASLLSACSGQSDSPNRHNGSGGMPDSTTIAGPFGKYPEPVEIRLGYIVDPSLKPMNGNSLENNPWRKEIKERLNIEMNVAWQVSKQNFDQKINLAIASSDLPDAVIVNQAQLEEMVKAEEIEDLTKVYENYASPEMKRIIDSTQGFALDRVIYDGKMMAIPSVASEDFSMLWIRQDWLDRLGLTPPKTMDELKLVAKAFVEQDPDGNGLADTIGLAASTGLYNDFSIGSFAFDLTPIFSAYNAYPGYWLKDAGGNLSYGSILPETKVALANLREMYLEGLIDPELGSRKAPEDVVISGKAGMFFQGFFGGYWPLPSAWKNDPDANWQAYALPLDAKGKYNIKISNPSHSFLVVRKGYAYPEAAIKMNNLYLEDESRLGNEFMLIRNFIAPMDEAKFETKAAQEVLAGTKNPEDFLDKPEYKLLKNTVKTIKRVKLEPYSNLAIQYWNQDDPSFMRTYSLLVGGRNFFDPNLNEIQSLSYKRTKTAKEKWDELIKLEHEAFLKIIMGSAPVDSFDQFVEDWKQRGGHQIIEEMKPSIK
ncbi:MULTISPECIES: extracellular solute-binding protein [Paenibacillus]|uniref:extracellular solute-binding protein n=1 Tax=Paenibacillus TaxID=44249 RepID=UPI002FDF66FB